MSREINNKRNNRKDDNNLSQIQVMRNMIVKKRSLKFLPKTGMMQKILLMTMRIHK